MYLQQQSFRLAGFEWRVLSLGPHCLDPDKLSLLLKEWSKGSKYWRIEAAHAKVAFSATTDNRFSVERVSPRVAKVCNR
ncbi:hypothetical protein MRB53_040516 [Persea americana]|nr:hypothetical protein MRB53_040516 [Persea americana]